MQRAIIILAAGKGSRMQSSVPKVLHPLAGAPLLWHVMNTAGQMDAARTVVVAGHCAEQITDKVAGWGDATGGVSVVLQEEQNGTAHAVEAARDTLADFDGGVFILYGDTPFIAPEQLKQMQDMNADIAVLGFESARPTGYGRLIMRGDEVTAIVEEKDATPAQRKETRCNSGVFYLNAGLLFDLLKQVGNNNAKGEYYLTDIVAIARAKGYKTRAVLCREADTLGVNSRGDLAVALGQYQTRKRQFFMDNGVTLDAPETVYFSYDTQIAPDVCIEPNVVFGAGVRIETGARIAAFSHLEGCHVRAGAVVGPFARLRIGADIGAGARVGNFVEIKNSDIGANAKVNHLSYIGDSDIGADSNIGAGVITCNYDGVAKHKTVVGAGAFVGSNSALVAPVVIGAGAVVGSGSVITRDVAPDALAITRAEQVEKVGAGARLMANKNNKAANKNNKTPNKNNKNNKKD